MSEGVVELSSLLPDGRASGSLPDGRVVRVAGAWPGDVVRVTVERGADARLDTIVTPGPARGAPACPWSAECGGCDQDGFAADARREALRAAVASAFRVDTLPDWVASPRDRAYRARIKLAIEGGRLGYRPPRSHGLVEVGTCGIARDEITARMPELRAWLERVGPDADALRAVELRSDGRRVVAAFESGGRVSAGLRSRLAELGDTALDGRPASGDPTLRLPVAGLTLRASPAAFYQVNLEQNEALVAHVRDAVLATRPERALDLYAGIGNLSLPLAATGLPVLAVEAPGPGTDDLRHNAGAFPTARALGCRVERFDASREAYDAVVLDPPRAGAAGVLAGVLRSRPKVVVYVSCHAPSAARDLAEVKGYRRVSFTCFDLFPSTHHVETVVVLERA